MSAFLALQTRTSRRSVLRAFGALATLAVPCIGWFARFSRSGAYVIYDGWILKPADLDELTASDS